MENLIATHNYIKTSDSDEVIAVPYSEADLQRIQDSHKRKAREDRNNELSRTVDQINTLMWESMSEEKKNAWRAYRQALLDVPQQPGFPYNIQWPVKPE